MSQVHEHLSFSLGGWRVIVVEVIRQRKVLLLGFVFNKLACFLKHLIFELTFVCMFLRYNP